MIQVHARRASECYERPPWPSRRKWWRRWWSSTVPLLPNSKRPNGCHDQWSLRGLRLEQFLPPPSQVVGSLESSVAAWWLLQDDFYNIFSVFYEVLCNNKILIVNISILLLLLPNKNLPLRLLPPLLISLFFLIASNDVMSGWSKWS